MMISAFKGTSVEIVTSLVCLEITLTMDGPFNENHKALSL